MKNEAWFKHSQLDEKGGRQRPVFEFAAGATRYTETLDHGRLVCQGWGADGQSPQVAAYGAWRDHPADSFQLILDGHDTRRGWALQRVDTVDDTHSVIHLDHEQLLVAVAVHTRVDSLGVLARWLEIENRGDQAMSITHAASWSGLLYRDLPEPNIEQGISQFEIGRYLHHNWAMEGRFAWESMPFGAMALEANRGTSGWGGPPMFMLRRRGLNEIFIGALGWSSNWRISLTYDPYPHFACLSFAAGPSGPPPLRVLVPGEKTATPRMHICFTKGDLDHAVGKFHSYERRSVMPSSPLELSPPVTYNGWGDFKKHPHEDAVLATIDVAGKLGAEMFVLDAGWFGRVEGSYVSSCGDWTPGAWIPSGIEVISQRVHELGMKFGLWVAFPLVGSKSKLFEDHPDWIIEVENRSNKAKLVEEAHPAGSMSIDLANPEVVQWLHAELDRIVTQYSVDMLRTDGGSSCYEGGYRRIDRYRENTLWRQCENYYAIFDRLRQNHPDLMIDNCIGGGGKLDLGMLERSHITWTSDDYHAPLEAIRSLNGVTLVIPPEYCTRLFGKVLRSADLSDPGMFEFAIRLPLFGQYCISGVPDEWRDPSSPPFKAIRRYVGIYKDFVRPMMNDCRVYHHTPSLVGLIGERPACCVLEYAAADASRALIGVFRLDGRFDMTLDIRPRGLDAQRTYRVRLDSADQTLTATGAKLADRGIAVTLTDTPSSELILIEAQSGA